MAMGMVVAASHTARLEYAIRGRNLYLHPHSLRALKQATSSSNVIINGNAAGASAFFLNYYGGSKAGSVNCKSSRKDTDKELDTVTGAPQQHLPWALLQLDGWDVPWGYGVTLLGLLGWLTSFLLTGLATSVVAQNLGIERRQILDLDEQAIFILFGQVLQTVTGLGTISLIVNKYKPLPTDMFVYDLRKPFDLQRGWLLWAGVGVLGAGAAVVTTSMIVSAVNGELPPREDGDALSLLLPLIGVSPLSTVTLVVVTGGLAPLLEETVFRGFLLASLTKRLPVPVAVVLSAAAFALAHLTPAEFPQLFALGIVIGFAYSKTHNMLTPIVIHSVWNSGVVVVLTALSLGGYDLRELLST